MKELKNTDTPIGNEYWTISLVKSAESSRKTDINIKHESRSEVDGATYIPGVEYAW